MKSGGWESGIHSVLGRDVSVGPHGDSILVPCKGGCGKVETVHLHKSVPPEGLRRILENLGWRLGSRRKCPPCNAPQAHQEKEQPVVDTKLSVVPPAPAIPTEAARAMRRAVLQWLEEAYDVTTGRYRAGVTDASIAKETGAAEEAVKKLREEFYGPLSEPTELAELRAEFAAIKREGVEARDAMDVKLSALNGRAAAAEQKLGRIAKANGWTL